MPTKLEVKVVDPEAEYSTVQRTYQKLAAMCSMSKRVGGVPQLATQEKQMKILTNELKETKLCISLAKKGQHGVRDAQIKKGMRESIVDYEELESQLRDERSQNAELECLNYLAKQLVVDLNKTVPTEADELAMLDDANNRLRRIENKLDLAIKRFCLVNSNNRQVREEIDRLLVERNDFNKQWQYTIKKLVKGKEYLMDVLEIASAAFSDREEYCRKLETLKWAGLNQLNKDIAEMQSYEGDLNHLGKLEEFLRVKGSRRICEADEIEEMKRLDEIARCENKIAEHDHLLDEIFSYAGTQSVPTISKNFHLGEVMNFSCFSLLCEILQECVMLKNSVAELRRQIMDRRDWNEGLEEIQTKRIAQLTKQLEEQHKRTNLKRELNHAADTTFFKVIKGISDLVGAARCDITPLLSLLGNHKELTTWNVNKFLRILETETKSLIQVAYGSVKPPPQTPKGRKPEVTKLVADPHVEVLRPNKIETLVPYLPCAYCVEDYIMNLVFETPAVPADKEYITSIFHLEEINTKFGIFTLTIPSKRHAYRDTT